MRLIDADALKVRMTASAPVVAQGFVRGVCTVIDLQPTIAAEPVKHAQNVYWEEKYDHTEFLCSACRGTIGCVEGGSMDGAEFNYCPNCGAKLDGGEE